MPADSGGKIVFADSAGLEKPVLPPDSGRDIAFADSAGSEKAVLLSDSGRKIAFSDSAGPVDRFKQKNCFRGRSVGKLS